MISREVVDPRPSQIGTLETGDHLVAASSHVLTHVGVQHWQHNEREQGQPSKKNHHRLQIAPEQVKRAGMLIIVHVMNLSATVVWPLLFGHGGGNCGSAMEPWLRAMLTFARRMKAGPSKTVAVF